MYFYKTSVNFLADIGGISILLKKILMNLRYLHKDRRLFLEQAIQLGYNSLPLILLVGIFTGAVSAWQANYQFENYIPLKYVGYSVYKAILIELAPVLTGLVIAGRVSSSIAAELGSMKVTEQIDALESLAIDPIRFLVMPRFVAITIFMPMLVIITSFVAVMGGFFVSNLFLGLSFTTFFAEIPRDFAVYDIFVCLIKAFVFGAFTSLIGCYIGINTMGGAEGVGNSTIQSFVWSSVLILMGDYLLAVMLF